VIREATSIRTALGVRGGLADRRRTTRQSSSGVRLHVGDRLVLAEAGSWCVTRRAPTHVPIASSRRSWRGLTSSMRLRVAANTAALFKLPGYMFAAHCQGGISASPRSAPRLRRRGRRSGGPRGARASRESVPRGGDLRYAARSRAVVILRPTTGARLVALSSWIRVSSTKRVSIRYADRKAHYFDSLPRASGSTSATAQCSLKRALGV
jgi:hypothetical protein